MTKKKLLIDLSMPTVFIAVALWMIIESTTFPGDEGVFPTLIGVFMFFVAIFIFVTTLRQDASKVDFKNINKRKVLEVVAALAFYVVLFKFVGYIIDTFILCSYVIITLGYKNRKLAMLYSAITTAIVFVIFKVVLGIPLPLLFLNF